MKRTGHIYEQMGEWHNIVSAEIISTRRKQHNYGVKSHAEHRMANLVEIQQMVLGHRMRTADYKHEQRVSGQDKVRDIAKLHFHPSHIQHQLLAMACEERLERSLIRHTYASRRGYGQIRCALQIKKNLRKYAGQKRWYAQGDICKYYESIRHSLIEQEMCRIIKDKAFVEAYLEPFRKFAPDGKGIPLGIRPSQSVGNLVLSRFDHYMLEQVKAADYVRYLDDFCFTGASKGEVKRKMKQAAAYLERLGFRLHTPKIHRVSEGLDMMGYVFYGRRTDMWWRRSNKRRWLRHRARVTNPHRLRELDDAAWGMLKWGNSHCRKLWQEKTGRKWKQTDMSINMANTGICRTERKDANGVPFIDAPRISMGAVLGKPVEIERWLTGVKTSQGDNRYVLKVRLVGDCYKLIVNSVDVKNLLDDMSRNRVTRLKTVFIDKGRMHYAMDETRTEIQEVNGREVTERDGLPVYADNGERIFFN